MYLWCAGKTVTDSHQGGKHASLAEPHISMIRPFSLFTLLFNALLGPSRYYIKASRDIGGNGKVMLGGNVSLPCRLDETTESLSQISWQRITRGNPQIDNFFIITSSESTPLNGTQWDLRFQFIGNFSDRNGSLLFSNVTLQDEGVYSCIFTLFPSGNHRIEIPLTVLVPPVTSTKDNHAILGNEEVTLATCTAASSRPPADVKWITGALAEKVKAVTNSTQHPNGTTTTMSVLVGVPTKDINQQSVKCVVTSPALSETLAFTLQVYFPPMEVKIKEKSKDAFECLTESNPNASFSWTRDGHSLPNAAVRVEGATLQLLSISSELNGLYQCEASNIYGRKSVQLYVHVTSGSCPACWVLFVLLLLAVLFAIGVAAWWYKFKKPQNRRGHTGGAGEHPVIYQPTCREST